VFLDGVEIPHQGVTVSSSLDAVSSCQIFVEPDSEIQLLRPDTIVHVFNRDPYPEPIPEEGGFRPANDKEAFRLVWEGSLVGYTFEKTGNSRFARLQAESFFGYLQRMRSYSIGVGYLIGTNLVSGSSQFNLGDTQSVLTHLQTLASDLTNTEGGNTPAFSDRLIGLIVYLSQFNASSRNIIVRSRLLDRITGVRDSILADILKNQVLIGLLKHTMNTIGETDTAFDVLRKVASVGYYHFAQVLFPFTPKQQPAGHLPHASVGKSDDSRIYRTERRNDYLVIPDTYYALPPPCNIIFPDNIQSISVERYYSGEPTRHFTQHPMIPTLVYSSPESRTLSTQGAATNLDALGTNTKVDSKNGNNFGVYYTKSSGVASNNLLLSLQESELEKGIISTISPNSSRLLPALSFSQNPSSGEPAAVRQSEHDAREYFLATTRYEHTMLKFSRSASITLVGNHSLVVGLPCLFVDRAVSYLGVVQGVTMSHTPQGQETATVQLKEVRELAPLKFRDKIDEALRGVADASDELKKGVDAARDAAQKEALGSQLARFSEFDREFDLFKASVDNVFSLIIQLNADPANRVPANYDALSSAALDAVRSLDSLRDRITVVTTIAATSSLTEAEQLNIELEGYFGRGAAMNLRVGDPARASLEAARKKIIELAALKRGKALDFLTVNSGLDVLEDLILAPQRPTFTTISEIVAVLLSKLATSTELRRFQDSGVSRAIEDILDTLYPDFAPQSTSEAVVSARNRLSRPIGFDEPNVPYVSSTDFVDITDEDKLLLAAAIGAACNLAVSMMSQQYEAFKELTVDPNASTFLSEALEDQMVRAASEEFRAAFYDILNRLENEYDIPAPPPFLSEVFMDLKKLDEFYANTLGCRRFYSEEPYAAQSSEVTSAFESIADLIGDEELRSNQRQFSSTQDILNNVTDQDKLLNDLKSASQRLILIGESVDNFLTGLKSLGALFPSLGVVEAGDFPDGAPTSWLDITQAQDKTSAYRWAYTEINRRKSTSMQEFAIQNDLLIEEEISSGLAPGLPPIPFLKFVPAAVDDNGYDETVFSKLVLPPLPGQSEDVMVGSSAPETSDREAVQAARGVYSKSDSLTTGGRQKLILQYAKKHFGSRAYDGS
jgi:hypothetical protein